MTASELKRLHEQHNPHSYFFTRESMRFAGDTMKNYGVCEYDADHWELYRRRPVKYGLKTCAYFRKDTFERVIYP